MFPAARWRSGTLCAIALLLAGCAASSVPVGAPSGSASIAAHPDPYAALILHDGESTTASGRVVSVPGRPVRFCAPELEPDVLWAPGHEPAPQYCDLGVDVTGVDLSALAGRREKDGAIEGQAKLTGVYRAGTLMVSKQESPSASQTTPQPPDQPPCQPPTGGWPQGPADENIDVDPINAYSTAHPGAILQVAMLRPSHTQVVALALTVGAADTVNAALAPEYHGRLCVVKSLYTAAQIDAAQQDLSNDNFPGFVYTTGQGLSPTAQVEVDIDAVVVTPALAAAALAQPAGLVSLDAWLAPPTN